MPPNLMIIPPPTGQGRAPGIWVGEHVNGNGQLVNDDAEGPRAGGLEWRRTRIIPPAVPIFVDFWRGSHERKCFLLCAPGAVPVLLVLWGGRALFCFQQRIHDKEPCHMVRGVLWRGSTGGFSLATGNPSFVSVRDSAMPPGKWR